MDAITPMLKQYFEVKSQHNDAILLFRMGDFYEMFFEDAEVASKILDITLTSRNKNDPNPVPLAGIPYHAADTYISKLLASGKKVAVCEQVEDPKLAKGVVKREVVRIMTPGVVLEPENLEAKENNYLVAVCLITKDEGRSLSAAKATADKSAGPEDGLRPLYGADKRRSSLVARRSSIPPSSRHPSGLRRASVPRCGSEWALAVCDVSTGDLRTGIISNLDSLIREIRRIEPREILIPRSLADELGELVGNVLFTVLDDPQFDPQAAGRLSVNPELAMALPAAGAILNYLAYTCKADLGHLFEIAPYQTCEYMVLDESTRRNLELMRTTDGGRHGSLLWLMDKTATAMGARCLKDWLRFPLLNIADINGRFDAVETLKNDIELQADIKQGLSKIADVERITSRISMGIANARELAALKNSLLAVKDVRLRLQGKPPHQGWGFLEAGLSGWGGKDGLLGGIYNGMNPCEELTSRIGSVLVDDLPLSVKEGGLIRDGVSAELDELRNISSDGKGFIARMEDQERRRTGIGSLKIRYNRVFGYYIEITHTHRDKIPPDYIRKQTLTNAERFITPELKEYENKVLSAEERICQLEYEIFAELKNFALGFMGQLKSTSIAVAKLDVLLSFANIANEFRYVRPVLLEGEIDISQGRHPIIERLNPTERFVPNDVHLNMTDQRVMIITGPNMAGKSTVMRQTGLIVLMAQMGSFVPADEARIGAVDRIFTRVGAQDALTRGQSTFMVEMTETATILAESTQRSLILIDEIGRGTSTFDGVSIAWAVAEYIHDKLEAKTMFATHFHELTDLALTKPGVKNFNIAVKEWNDQIIFLRKLVPGGVNRSYGIHVARLAGLPKEVLERAKEVLSNLESGELNETGSPRIANRSGVPPNGGTDCGAQLDLFSYSSEVLEILKNIDTTTITPIEALNLLHQLKEKL